LPIITDSCLVLFAAVVALYCRCVWWERGVWSGAAWCGWVSAGVVPRSDGVVQGLVVSSACTVAAARCTRHWRQFTVSSAQNASRYHELRMLHGIISSECFTVSWAQNAAFTFFVNSSQTERMSPN